MNREIILKEIVLKGIRSSGAGGQNVNKVATKIELSFDLTSSKGLSPSEKVRLQETLASKLTQENFLIIQCDESRSQFRNKQLAIKRFLEILKKGLFVQKPRKATRPTKSSITKRLDKKKNQAQKKANRRKPEL